MIPYLKHKHFDIDERDWCLVKCGFDDAMNKEIHKWKVAQQK